MNNNSGKIKTFIIIFIAVLAVLLIGFLLFKNSSIFGVKTATTINKVFSPLFGTSKQNSLTQINTDGTNTNQTSNTTDNTNGGETNTTDTNGGTNNNGSNTNGDNTNPNNNTNNTTCNDKNATNYGGALPCSYSAYVPDNLLCKDKNATNYGSILPCLNPIIIPNTNPVIVPKLCEDPKAANYKGNLPCKYKNNNGGNVSTKACSDNKDNDGDGFIDIADTACHTDHNNSNINSYDPSINDENLTPIIIPTGDICLEDPLDKYYTVEERAKLAVLLRKFYLIAPTLKIQDDVDLVKNEIDQDNTLIDQSVDLIGQCNAQKADPKYTGPKTTYGNPYYKPDESGTYVPGYENYEIMFNIW